jgi:uncharacterized Zn finger protein
MPRRRSGWDYSDYGSGPRHVKDGLKAKSERGAIGESWWSKRWVEVLESFELGNRLTRGRSYARKGQVVSIDITPGRVRAKVQGSQPRPYSVSIKLEPLLPGEWEKVVVTMSRQAIFAAKLLAGEMPQNIEEAFGAAGVSLFPRYLDELDTDCSCPDWSNPCKHLAAVYYLLAEQFDEDPFLIFKLRGMEKEELIRALREKRASTLADIPEPPDDAPTSEDEPPGIRLEDSLENFWRMGEGLSEFHPTVTAPEINAVVLRVLGAPPFGEKGLDITNILAEVYSLISEKAREMGNA